MKVLPIGIQSFTKLRDKNCVYVDKTELIHQLLMGSGAYFFARPRRFGKSMTLSTLKAIYEGKKEYFTDLWIADKWDWTRRNPIIHLKFASMFYGQIGIEPAISMALQKIANTSLRQKP